MINLKLQVASLLFSFLFGIFVSFTTEVNYKFIKYDKKIFKILFTSLFVLVHVLSYFIGLKYINNGYLHSYFLFMIVLGGILGIFIRKSIVKIKFK